MTDNAGYGLITYQKLISTPSNVNSLGKSTYSMVTGMQLTLAFSKWTHMLDMWVGCDGRGFALTLCVTCNTVAPTWLAWNSLDFLWNAPGQGLKFTVVTAHCEARQVKDSPRYYCHWLAQGGGGKCLPIDPALMVFFVSTERTPLHEIFAMKRKWI